VPTEIRDNEIIVRLGDRRYRIRGLRRNLAYDVLKVNLLAGRGDAFHVDTFDLYAAKPRSVFVRQAAGELGLDDDVVKKDLGRVLLALEDLQEQQIQEALDPKPPEVTLTDAQREEALALLRDPRLLERILEDYDRCGVVGEETNKLVGYLAAVSRKLDDPLAVIVQSSSAAGKSSLMEAILAFVPAEDQVKYSAMTGQSLFYMGETNLKHRVLAIVEEEGAERASYALKLLQSEGELTIASTGKDATTGLMTTHEYRVEGPVMILLTTTSTDVDEELLNRCLVLTVSEDAEQTSAIHGRQRQKETIGGVLADHDRTRTWSLHKNAQRLLSSLIVVNPYADRLTFPVHKTRMRRDHAKYLALIRSIALLHQHQRPVKKTQHEGQTVAYIEVTLDDIAVANRLCHEVLGRTLDELPPQTRRLLELLDDMVRSECERLEMETGDFRFTRRQVREHTGWGNTQLKVHLGRLEDYEYLHIHHGGRGQTIVYELCFAASPDEGPRLAGLIDVEVLRRGYDEKKSGSADEKSGASRPQVGPKSGGGRGDETARSARSDRADRVNGSPRTEKRTTGARTYTLRTVPTDGEAER
jgi:hypothetical protein